MDPLDMEDPQDIYDDAMAVVEEKLTDARAEVERLLLVRRALSDQRAVRGNPDNHDGMEIIMNFLEHSKHMVGPGEDQLVWALTKNRQVWDASTHEDDIIAWANKIWVEEEDAILGVEFRTYEEIYKWRTGE